LRRLGTAYFADQSYPAAKLCFRHAPHIYAAVLGRWSLEAFAAAANLAMVSEIAGHHRRAPKLRRAGALSGCSNFQWPTFSI